MDTAANLRLILLTLVLVLAARPQPLYAQDQDFRFQPPKPPPLDVDFDEEDDEDFGDEMARRAVPMAPAVVNPGSAAGRVDPVPLAPPSDFGSSTVSAGKFRFRVVEGEFYRKGQRRTRGREQHVDGSEGSRAGGGGGMSPAN